MPRFERQGLGDLRAVIWVLAPLFAVIISVDLLWVQRDGVTVDYSAFKVSCLISLGAMILGLAFLIHPVTSKFGKTLFYLAILFPLPCPLLLLCELILTTGRPLIDPWLAAADQLFGFDWVAYRAMILSYPMIAEISQRCYSSMGIQVTSLTLILGLSGHFKSLSRFVLTLIICSVFVMICGGMFPAVGAYEYYLGDDPTGIGPLLHSLREGHGALANAADFKGAVSFPSYHTVMALCFCRAAWRHRYLRWPVLAANAFMLIGIPLYGAHYLVDMVGGALLMAAIDFAVSQWLSDQGPRCEPAFMPAEAAVYGASREQ